MSRIMKNETVVKIMVGTSDSEAVIGTKNAKHIALPALEALKSMLQNHIKLKKDKREINKQILKNLGFII